ncbi:transcriptional regulator [Rhizobium rhizosphaerae]|uniref:Transcriptional regulator n=1 Tax=Xaviernesmea rhizosphaerae TaxID=1672749 RepID=A0A1Q9AHW4_9HYPH|nr:substrate-binding domain-containing protein [Xaviernesmea rhizosphaerae]OLP54817.1 transcriptional regulator [Xaviernesmea rhizosphaerae]
MTTLQQVAERAGCSLASASRVLGCSGPVSEQMARRVRRAAAELGYRPERLAATSRSTRRPVVGILIPSITNPVFAASLSSIENRMLLSGHGVLIAQSHYDPEREVSAVHALLNDRPTGLILTLCDPESSRVLDLPLPPTVLLNNPPTPRQPAAVTVPNRAAGATLAGHLLDLGHRRILFVSGNFAASDRARLRHQGYLDALARRGVAPLPPMQVPFIGSYDQLDLTAILAQEAPTAVIASNDLLAFGVIGALRRQGLGVPQDLSVAGFDGIAIGQMMTPALTTIEMPDASMGAVAASLLLDMAENAAVARHLQLAFSLRAGGTARAV